MAKGGEEKKEGKFLVFSGLFLHICYPCSICDYMLLTLQKQPKKEKREGEKEEEEEKPSKKVKKEEKEEEEKPSTGDIHAPLVLGSNLSMNWLLTKLHAKLQFLGQGPHCGKVLSLMF